MANSDMKVTVTVPATTANLGPGFDCLGLALALYNRVELCPAESGLSVSIEGEGTGVIPTDESNMMVQAAHRLFAHVGRPVPGLHFRQVNRIPVSSGLGSSAAAVLSGMLAANCLLPSPLSRAEVLSLATEIEGHPDNTAPALRGGLVLANQDGERLVVENLPIGDLHVIAVLPAFALSTIEARAVLPRDVPFADAIFNAGRVALLVQALAEGDYGRLGAAMQDRLHQPYRVPLIPGMEEAFIAARAAGAAGVALSGAGPGIIAFAAEGHEEIAASICEAFATAGLQSRSWILPVDRRGSVVECE